MIRHAFSVMLVSAGISGLLALSGCATPDKPVRATLYDFGPGLAALAPAPAPASATLQQALVLGDVSSSGALDGSAVLYRLGYADAHQLRPYANARWTAPPPQLIRQRLREQLSRERPVLDVSEFSHYFETPTQSAGLLRLRVTLLENTPPGERLVAQRSLVVRSPAPTPDAPGGVRALAAATDAAADEINRWLAQAR